MGATQYDPKLCGMLKEHMRKGGSFKTFAGAIEVPYSTVKSWLKQHEEFKDARDIGEALSELFWDKLGMAGIMGKVKGFKEKTYLQFMQERFNWSEKHKVEHSGDGGAVGGVRVNFYIPDNGRDGKLKGREDDRLDGDSRDAIESDSSDNPGNEEPSIGGET